MIEYWRKLSDQQIDADRIVAGLHEIEMLEGMTPYRNSRGLYFPRVQQALAGLPARFWDPALSVFASVMFVPERVLSATLEYLWWRVLGEAERAGNRLEMSGTNVHIMEVDIGDLVPDFARSNSLSGRLNPEVHPRLLGVQHLRHALTAVLDGRGNDRDVAIGRLRRAGAKSAWVILTDKALSGQSLLGDLERISFTRAVVGEVTGHVPDLYICAQIATHSAEASVKEWFAANDVPRASMITALRIDSRAKVGSPDCELFSDEETHERVLELCDWFDREIVARDTSLETVRARSGGSLARGYKECGLTLVDYRNTPTNSLPLLWFNTEDVNAEYAAESNRPTYVAPFPRVHSRRGREDPRWSERSQWDMIMNPSARSRLVEGLSQ